MKPAGIALGLALAAGAASAQETPPVPSATPSSRPLLVYGGAVKAPPYEYLDSRGQPQGFNIELARALGVVGGREVEIRLRPWSEVLTELVAGRIQLVSMGYTEARAQRYDFLAETWTARQSVIFLPGRPAYPTQFTDIAREIVALEERSLAHDLLQTLPEVSRPLLRPEPSHEDAVRLMLRGGATAVAGNSLVLRVALADLGVTDLVEVPVKTTSYHLATVRGRGQDLAWVAPALKRLRESGEYSRLVEKHLAAPRRPAGWREYLVPLAILLGAVAAVMAGAAAWTVSLRRQVQARTREISASAQEKERLIAELAAKNTELERFTYTVSHDLKSPLITIRSYLDLLEKSVLEANTERFRSDLARIVTASDKMRQLLDDLLELSRIGRVLNPPEDVALRELAQEAAALASGRLADGRLRVEIAEDLGVVRGDRRRLLEVLQNLVDNAANFMGEQPEPCVEIGVRSEGERQVYFVRDNGIGIEPRHLDKVFGLFDKLDPASGGTGVGLALVRRIVEAHEGRTWAESQGKGQGSTFCFTLHEGSAGARSR